jgi:hypothetical protein
MNAIALQPDLGLVLAHARLYERLAEGAVERRRLSMGPSLGERIVRGLGRIRRAISDPSATSTTNLPALTDYPYAR